MLKKIVRLGLISLGSALGALAVTAIVVGNRRVDAWEDLTIADADDGEFVEVKGQRFHYYARGAGTPVILVHGFLDSAKGWYANFDELARYHRVYAFDMIGFGFSSRLTQPRYSLRAGARGLAGFMDALGIQKASIVGHSLGGALALQFAHDYPGCVEKLVLEDAAPFLLKRLPPVTRAVGYAPRVTRGLLGWYLLNRRVALHGLSQIFGRVSPTHHARVDVFFKHTRVKGSMDALVAMLGSPMDDDLPEVIADITVPTLIVWGERDRVVPLSHGRRLRQLLPNSKLAIVESAGHIPHEEFPDQVNELLLEFL